MMTKTSVTKALWPTLLLVLFLFSACEKEQLVPIGEELLSTNVASRSTEPPFVYAVTEYDGATPSRVYQIDRSSGLPTGQSTLIYYHGAIVPDVIGITRMAHIDFNGGAPFYAITVGPDSGIPQDPSVVYGISDISTGHIDWEINDNTVMDGVPGRYVKDIEWSDWGGLNLIGVEAFPRNNGFHYLVDFATPHNEVTWPILNVPASEEVRGLSWVAHGDPNNFNCPATPQYPLHFFDAFDYTNGGTLPPPPSGFYTLYLTTLSTNKDAKLYSLVFNGNTIEAYYIGDPQPGLHIPGSELALGWDYANNFIYVGGNNVEEYNFDALPSCPSEPWNLTNQSTGSQGWNASIADFTSQPFNF